MMLLSMWLLYFGLIILDHTIICITWLHSYLNNWRCESIISCKCHMSYNGINLFVEHTHHIVATNNDRVIVLWVGYVNILLSAIYNIMSYYVDYMNGSLAMGSPYNTCIEKRAHNTLKKNITFLSCQRLRHRHNMQPTLCASLTSLPTRHDTSIQCWTNVGPPSTTLAQHCSNIGSMCRVCWISCTGETKRPRFYLAFVRCCISPFCTLWVHGGAARAKGSYLLLF